MSVLCVLGPLEVVRGGQPVRLGSRRQRLALAVLAVHANEVVSTDRLAGALWGDTPPPSAVHTLHTLVARLRAVVGSDRIETRPPGYRLRIEPEELDALRFEELVHAGLAATDRPDAALRVFDEALALWRGPAFAEFVDEEFAEAEAARLEELRMDAIEARAAALVEVDRAGEAVGELEAQITHHPLRERLRAILMLALARAGRPVEALRAYEAFRRFLAEEIGVVPSPELQQLNDDIARQHPDLGWERSPSSGVAAADLPSGTVTFLFTDVVGSSRLWEEHPETMKDALARHDVVLRDAVEGHGGEVVKTTGDGVHAVFGRAEDAVAAAVGGQRALGAERWAETGPLRVRMGLHTGTAEIREGDYFGPALNRAARIAATAHGGQVVVSHATEAVLPDVLPNDLELVDLGEHRLQDLSRPERVFQVVHPDLVREFPRLRSLDALPGNLSLQVTSFVGRELELEQVGRELGEARVVTLTGVGGVGKTRLALQVAAELLPRYRDGAWLCELAGVRDPDAVPDAVAAVFDVKGQPGQELTDALVEFLRVKELVLVLDNCEHLLHSVARLVTAVERTCENVSALATSREGLNIDGERIVVVGSLEVPEPEAELEAIARSAGVRLFVERAAAVRTDFSLSAANAEAVAQLCRRLDGIALAIELAAARVPTFTPTELVSRLDQRFRVLTGGRRSAVQRHQTLRAAIDWSYDLLDGTEQRLLDRLGVFVGGFTLDGAEAVTGGEGIDPDGVWELLASLVRQSLVVADDVASETRYRLLETMRAYAQERLDEAGDADRVRREHARYYATFAETAVPSLAGSDEVAWTIRVDRELDNFRAALHWAIDAPDADTALRLLSLSGAPPPSWTSGFNRTVDAFAEAVLAIPGVSEHPKFPAGLAAAAWLAWDRGDHKLAARHSEDALDAEQRLDTQPPLSYLWVVRANLALAEGRMDKSVEHWERAVEILRANDDPALIAPLAFLATIRAAAGNPAAAIPEAEEALTLARRVGAPGALAIALAAAGSALADSDPQRALALMREAVEVEDSLGHGGGRALIIAANFANRHGTRREALDLFAKSLEQASWTRRHASLEFVLGSVGELLAIDEPEVAAVILGAASALAPGWGQLAEERQQAVATLTTALGEARLAELRARGAAMDNDEVITYARAAISRALNE